MKNSPNQLPRVAIVILNWNGLKDTLECLESLNKIVYPDYEIVIVDNGSGNNEAGVLEAKFGRTIKIIKNDINFGFAAGNNIAVNWLLQKSNAKYYLLLNNDTVVDPEFLGELVKIADSDDKIAIAGPKTYFMDTPNMIQLAWFKVNIWTGAATQFGSNAIDTGQYDQIKEVDYLQGSCLLLRQDTIKQIGFFDEKYFCYWEETDYCYRARKEGYKIIYVPRSKIWHKKNVTLRPKWYKALFLKDKPLPSNIEIYLMTRNTFWFMKKQARGIQLLTFHIYYFCISFWYRFSIYSLYYRKFNLLKAFFKGIKDGLIGSGKL